MRAELDFDRIKPVSTPEAAADGSEIIITITTAREPVLLNKWVGPGAHINAAGGNSLLRREVDDELVARASVVVVDSIDQARIEAFLQLRALVQALKHRQAFVSAALRGLYATFVRNAKFLTAVNAPMLRFDKISLKRSILN